jgi:hypothetical protein
MDWVGISIEGYISGYLRNNHVDIGYTDKRSIYAFTVKTSQKKFNRNICIH